MSGATEAEVDTDVSALAPTLLVCESPKILMSADDKNICKDFLRQRCRRGESCKLVHPVEIQKQYDAEI